MERAAWIASWGGRRMGEREAAVAQGLWMGCWQLLISKLLHDNSCYGLSHRRPLVSYTPQSAVN